MNKQSLLYVVIALLVLWAVYSSYTMYYAHPAEVHALYVDLSRLNRLNDELQKSNLARIDELKKYLVLHAKYRALEDACYGHR